MAILKKSLPLAVSLVIASSFAGADQLEETVVVADRVKRRSNRLLFRSTSWIANSFQLWAQQHYRNCYVPKLASQQRKRAVLARSVAFESEDKMASELVY